MNCIIGCGFVKKIWFDYIKGKFDILKDMNINIEAKRILCYGDSNTWGWIPGGMGKKRYKINERYPGILYIL